ncbi:glycoside hydrolase family 15 protein [Arthrobacter psychrochitiniphilus]|uniref:Glycoside hydrolase family 15 n=1 Tax=Arthrobacter psychrochitiniphilus TaxID=291045 RepID=A0A2V3DTH8_9MICC|nr:glycoside hydrolase family 15 protein [Arthrobacter psychrochitiniphilus]NYG19040.1 GH15 family glucan-1,4-alpha-glucosidase [Arthrobacter psychrochitiniphilus]PXA65984.1 glycoside hydrolase family 15 [Arthrobacter psychrochitiniphilus]
MASRIEDYALLSDLHTGALVGRDGSIDWLCFPRFDSPSVFTALLGTSDHGRWLMAPSHPEATVAHRRYVGRTFVLETVWETPTGTAKITDFMPIGDRRASLVRRIEGISGSVEFQQNITIRPGYGKVLPWVRRVKNADGSEGIVGVAGPDALVLRGDELPHAAHREHAGKFTVQAGARVEQELVWYPSHRPEPRPIDTDAALTATCRYWDDWAARYNHDGKYAGIVERSLLVLRALTHQDTGGIVAAPTTSLPEEFGGARNWDYRFCWLRDAALTLEAMLTHGYAEEALKWRDWLLRAVAGDPEDLQIMYGLSGERNLPEGVLDHLPGYEGAAPVRIGNGAVGQYQADVVGEVLVSLEKLRLAGGHEDHFSWPLQQAMLGFVENHLSSRDHGIWEMRGDLSYFTHSRVMMWAAFDCAVRAVRNHGLAGHVERWEELREQLRAEIMEHGFNKELNTFTQTYGGTTTDASLLVLPQVGFVGYGSPEMLGTVAALESELVDEHGLIMRYQTTSGIDGLEPGEHPFLACSFWLVEQYAHTGRRPEAVVLMDTLVGLANEVGLLSEEYDMGRGRMAGNFPQAFSHLALVRAADALHGTEHLSLSTEPIDTNTMPIIISQ